MQAFQHRKALTLERDANAHTIVKMSIPKEIKHYGDKMPTAQKWESVIVNIMEDIVFQKFAQTPNLRNKLYNTLQLPLYESTTNKFWGCGLKLNSRLWSSGNFPGLNLMGQILMRVHARLQDTRPSAAAASPSSSGGEKNRMTTVAPSLVASVSVAPNLLRRDEHMDMSVANMPWLLRLNLRV